MILGGSGFIGHGLYQELYPYYNVHCTYRRPQAHYDQNHKFHLWDVETEPLGFLLENLNPDIIISAFRGNFAAQINAHHELITHILTHDCKLLFLSSANVFDAFVNFPSYEYDKTFSLSVYGKFKINIENALLRLPNEKYNILRIPMIFGADSPRVNAIKDAYQSGTPLEVFPNVVINATTLAKITQQIHYIINQESTGVFHLGSTDLTHHEDLILDICEKLEFNELKITQVYESNDDRYLAILPKANLLPKHLQITIQDVIDQSAVIP